MQRLEIAGHDQRYPALDPRTAQPTVDQVLALAANDHGDMACFEECSAFCQLQGRGMATPHRERVGVLVEKLPIETFERISDGDDDVERAGEFGGHDRRTTPWHD